MASRSRATADDVWVKHELEVDDALESFLNSVGKKVKVRRDSCKRTTCDDSGTIWRPPSVGPDLQRFDPNDEGIRQTEDGVFIRESPEAQTEARIVAGAKVRGNSRAKDCSPEKVWKLPRVIAPSKPKFLDRLISGSGLSKKSGDGSRCKRPTGTFVAHQDTIVDQSELSDDEGDLSGTERPENDIRGYLYKINDSPSHPSVDCIDFRKYCRKSELEAAPEEDTEDLSSQSSPIVPGLVRQRLQSFQKLSPDGDLNPTVSGPQSRCRSEARIFPGSSRSELRCFSPVSEKANRLVKSFYSFSRDTAFSQAVMEKGYVRALAEQINSGKLQSVLIDDNDGDAEEGDSNDNGSEKVDIPQQGKVCGSSCQEGDIERNVIVHTNTTHHQQIATCHSYEADVVRNGVATSCVHSTDGSRVDTGSDGTLGSKMSEHLGGQNSPYCPSSPRSPRSAHSSRSKLKEGERSESVSVDKPKSPKPPKTPEMKPSVDYHSKCSLGASGGQGDVCDIPGARGGASPRQDRGMAAHAEGPVDDAVQTQKENSRTYDDKCFRNTSLTPEDLFNLSWDSDSEFSEESDFESELTENTKSDHEEQALESVAPREKLHQIADELLKTERTYVARLRLLHEDFYLRIDQENRQHSFLPGEHTVRDMFSNIQSIYQFHKDFVLRDLEQRMDRWHQEKRIGDLMKKNAPFLKLYTAYIKNFDHAMSLINHWLEKSPKFAAIVHEVQKSPECGSLSLQHHMLEPIQRVPRYELLLKDYVKHLPPDSPDKQDAQEALDRVTEAAIHSNEAMKKIEKFHKLLDIYQKLRGITVDFISPTRDFVQEGPITKISARSGEKQSRFLFLFNDLLLICSEFMMGTYKVRSQLDIDGMEVKHGDNPNIPDTFLVLSKQKAIELLDENPNCESSGWYELLKRVIKEYRNRKRSLRNDGGRETPGQMSPEDDTMLGKQAPRWIPDDAATMCMICELLFTRLRRRHHCRACGQLICGSKGCSKKAPLDYMDRKMARVCTRCHEKIVYRGQLPSPGGETSPKKKGVLQVKASDPGLLSGYLQISDDSAKTWNKRWFTLREDFVMYFFRARKDVSAYHSLPLPGYAVDMMAESDKSCIFRVHHKNKKVFFFQAENDRSMKKWVAVLNKLVLAQLPDESQRLSSQSNSSSGSNTSDTAATPTTTNPSSSSSNSDKLSQADSGCPADSLFDDGAVDGDLPSVEEGGEQEDNGVTRTKS